MRITSSPTKNNASSSCLQHVFLHHMSVFVTHPRDDEQQWCMTSRGAPRQEEWDAPSVTKTETGASHSTVISACLQWQHYLSAREQCKCVHVQYDTYDERERSKSQEVGCWLYLQCCCTQTMISISGIPILLYSRGGFNGADPILWLNFTCFMVNKSSQDFEGLLST